MTSTIGGRPSLYSNETAQLICTLLAEGHSLRSICADLEMPGRETVRRWLADEGNTAFRAQYARAREEQADHYADEIIEIADTENDWQRARVRIDARKWKASKMAPRVYGDRIDMTSKGERIDIGAWILRARRARERADAVDDGADAEVSELPRSTPAPEIEIDADRLARARARLSE